MTSRDTGRHTDTSPPSATGTVAIFAPRNTQPITLAKHVDDTWRGYAGDRPIALTTSSIYSRNGSFTIIHTPEW